MTYTTAGRLFGSLARPCEMKSIYLNCYIYLNWSVNKGPMKGLKGRGVESALIAGSCQRRAAHQRGREELQGLRPSRLSRHGGCR